MTEFEVESGGALRVVGIQEAVNRVEFCDRKLPC
jgi:hypothetical protein